MQICFGFSLKFRISTHWNQVNHLLIKGPDFITCKGKMEAIGEAKFLCLNDRISRLIGRHKW